METRSQYQQQVEAVWEDRQLAWDDVGWLRVLALELGLSGEEAASVERDIMGDIKEVVLYRQEVQTVWQDGRPNAADVERLRALEAKLALSRADAAAIECYVVGETVDAHVERTRKPDSLPQEPRFERAGFIGEKRARSRPDFLPDSPGRRFSKPRNLPM